MALLLLGCSEVEDAEQTTSITGRVIDSTGAPIEGAVVSTVPPTQTVLTDPDGRFEINGVRFTISYVVNADKDGFQMSSGVVVPTSDGPNDVPLSLEVQSVCRPGSRRCVRGGGDGVESCNGLGNAYEGLTLCPDGQSCDPVDVTCKISFGLNLTVSDFGVVRSEPTGINCGMACERDFLTGTTVTLAAIPLARGGFVEWGGDCAGVQSEQCTVTMDSPREVSATFEAIAFPVRARKAGSGRGRITSMPPGIDCGPTCEADFDRDVTVVFTAEPDEGYDFERWQRDCSSDGESPSCSVVVSRARTVQARFLAPGLTIGPNTGPGAGTVTSDPRGINCGSNCFESYAPETVVTLTATPEEGSTFEGWTGGGCPSRPEPCVVVMDRDRTVSPRFDGLTFPVTITSLGDGGGRVTFGPDGIDCTSTCTRRFAPETMLELIAVPNSDSGFLEWGGECAGTDPESNCRLTVDEARSASVRFEPFYWFPLAKDPDCVVGMTFDGTDPLEHACGAGGAAQLFGSYRLATSRFELDQAYESDDSATFGGLDTGRTMPPPPEATLELTVRRDGPALDGTGRTVLISDIDASSPTDGLRLLALDSGEVVVEVLDQGQVVATATAADGLPVNRWTHVAATVQATEGIEVFIDGDSRVSVPGPLTWTASSPVWVGAERDQVSGARHRLDGSFDEVRLSRSARY